MEVLIAIDVLFHQLYIYICICLIFCTSYALRMFRSCTFVFRTYDVKRYLAVWISLLEPQL